MLCFRCYLSESSCWFSYRKVKLVVLWCAHGRKKQGFPVAHKNGYICPERGMTLCTTSLCTTSLVWLKINLTFLGFEKCVCSKFGLSESCYWTGVISHFALSFANFSLLQLQRESAKLASSY